MSFAQPLNLLWAALALAGFVALYRAAEARARRCALAHANLAFLEGVVPPDRLWERATFGALVLGVALLGVASAGPHLTLKLPTSEGTVVVCVDTSGSMASSDVDPTRAQAATAAIRRFVQNLGGGVRVGLVSFATEAQVDLQPTADRETIADAVDTIPRPNGATAIGDALQLAGTLLPKTGRRAIVLLTDGVNNRGVDPLEASHDLAAAHVPVFTIGIGTSDSGKLIPGTEEQATSDPDALAQYAQITGGTATMAADAGAIVDAFATLARSAIWESRRVDASLIAALTGGATILGAFLVSFCLGKLP